MYIETFLNPVDESTLTDDTTDAYISDGYGWRLLLPKFQCSESVLGKDRPLPDRLNN